jgi:hypothetical protein
MEAAEQWEPDDARVSRPVLRERGGEIPPRHSPRREDRRSADVPADSLGMGDRDPSRLINEAGRACPTPDRLSCQYHR